MLPQVQVADAPVWAWCNLTFLPETTWTHVLAPPGAMVKFRNAPAGAMCSCMMGLGFLGSADPFCAGQCLSVRSCSTTIEGAANSSCSQQGQALSVAEAAQLNILAVILTAALTDKEINTLVS